MYGPERGRALRHTCVQKDKVAAVPSQLSFLTPCSSRALFINSTFSDSNFISLVWTKGETTLKSTVNHLGLP